MTWLEKYQQRGFRLLFYPSKSKGPSGPSAVGWTSRHDKAESYIEGQNVGIFTGVEIAPGKFLADVDFDWLDGLALRDLLPSTNFGFGRQSRIVSHAFYTTSTPIPSKEYKDVDGTMFVELRSAKKDGTIGLQTMAAPSVHPFGEIIELRADGEITHSDILPRRVLLYAIGCILLKHLGQKGLLHDARLAVAGFLLSSGLEEEEAIELGQVLAKATQNNIADMATAVKSTADKLRKGEHVTAKNALANAIGKDGREVLARIKEWLGGLDSLDELVADLNERFALVSVGTKVVVMETYPDGAVKGLWPFDEFRRLMIKARVVVDGKARDGADLWLKHPNGRQYNQLVYAGPGSEKQAEPGDYNAWLGFTVTPQKGDWERNRNHLFEIICSQNDKAYHWLLNWLAALVQKPFENLKSAVVLRGEQGIGKGYFGNNMIGGLFFKQQHLHIIGAGMLTGRFNEHLSGKVYVFADESTWGGDPTAAEKLKGLISETTIPIERKFLPLVEEHSALHIVIASNSEWPVSVPLGDRRNLVLDVAEAKRQDDTYFAGLQKELENGGRAAMLADLLDHVVDESLNRHPAPTAGKREVMQLSLKPVERWWLEKLLKGSLSLRVTNKDGSDSFVEGWPLSIQRAALHEDYLLFLDKLRDNRTRRSTETELGMFIRKYTPMPPAQKRLPATGTAGWEYFWNLPSLEACRVRWVELSQWGSDFQWGEEG